MSIMVSLNILTFQYPILVKQNKETRHCQHLCDMNALNMNAAVEKKYTTRFIQSSEILFWKNITFHEQFQTYRMKAVKYIHFSLSLWSAIIRMCTHYTEQAEIQYLLAWLLPSNWWMAWPQSWLHRKFHLFPSTPADGIACCTRLKKPPSEEEVTFIRRCGQWQLFIGDGRGKAQSESMAVTSQQPRWAEESNGVRKHQDVSPWLTEDPHLLHHPLFFTAASCVQMAGCKAVPVIPVEFSAEENPEPDHTAVALAIWRFL